MTTRRCVTVRTPMRIEDPDDPRIADYRHLTDAALRRAHEHDAGVFIAEGHFTVAELLRSPYPVRSFLVTPARLDALQGLLDSGGTVTAPIYVAEREVMATIVGFDSHRGLLAAGQRRPLPA